MMLWILIGYFIAGAFSAWLAIIGNANNPNRAGVWIVSLLAIPLWPAMIAIGWIARESERRKDPDRAYDRAMARYRKAKRRWDRALIDLTFVAIDAKKKGEVKGLVEERRRIKRRLREDEDNPDFWLDDIMLEDDPTPYGEK